MTPQDMDTLPDELRDLTRVRAAIMRLREARDLLKAARCPRALDRVRKALSSAKGAERAVGYRNWQKPRKARQDREDDSPSLEDRNCDDAGTGEGRWHGRV